LRARGFTQTLHRAPSAGSNVATHSAAQRVILRQGVIPRVPLAQHSLHDLHALSLRDEFAPPRVTELMGCIARITCLVDQTRGLTHPGPLIMQRVVGHSGAAVRQEHHLVVRSGRSKPLPKRR